jgi:hypothetical protein
MEEILNRRGLSARSVFLPTTHRRLWRGAQRMIFGL